MIRICAGKSYVGWPYYHSQRDTGTTVIKRQKYIYGCFVDFSKACDRIPRGLLFQKPLACRINGKVFNL